MMRAARRATVAAGLCAVCLLAGCSQTGEPQQTAASVTVPVGPGGVTQTFVPTGDRLSRVTVTAATFGAASVEGTLTAELAGAGEQRTVDVDGGAIADNSTVPLVFTPVREAAGQPFSLTLSWAGPDPLALYAAPGDAYPDGALTPGGGDLTFTVAHAGRVSGAVAAIGRVPGEAVSRLTRAPVFTAVWLASLAALVAAVGRSAWRAR